MPLHTRGPFGCRMTVQNFVKIVWTVFEKFEIFMKRSGEKKTKKQHDCISSRKFFPTPNSKNSKRWTLRWNFKNRQFVVSKKVTRKEQTKKYIKPVSSSDSSCIITSVSFIFRFFFFLPMLITFSNFAVTCGSEPSFDKTELRFSFLCRRATISSNLFRFFLLRVLGKHLCFFLPTPDFTLPFLGKTSILVSGVVDEVTLSFFGFAGAWGLIANLKKIHTN